MNNLSRAQFACGAVVLGILWGPELGRHPAWATDVTVTGSYHTTNKTGPFADYSNDKTEVTVSYTIATKVDPKTGKKTFDLSDMKSFVTFTNNFNGNPFTTVKIQITQISGDPNTGQVTSFKFNGTDWDPKRLSTGRQSIKDDGVSGEVDLTNKTATIESKYKDKGGDVASYTFATQNDKPGKAKADPKTGQPIETYTSIPSGKTVEYNGATKILSIVGDTIVATPNPSDPILGAKVNFSDYQFTGLTPDGKLAIFWSTSVGGLMSVTKGASTLEKGDLPVLFYDVADNLFFGSPLDYALAGMPAGSPFFDPSLPSISSPFLNSLESVLDPASSNFDSEAYLFLTLSPVTNLDLVTNAFTISGESGATDSEFVADVPESSTWAMLLLGFAGFGLTGYRASLNRTSDAKHDRRCEILNQDGHLACLDHPLPAYNRER